MTNILFLFKICSRLSGLSVGRHCRPSLLAAKTTADIDGDNVGPYVAGFNDGK